jgi:alpha-beta hydrolase superfamily lysophospholipase
MTTIKWVGYTLCLFGGAKRKGRWMNKIVFGSFNNPFKPSRTDFDWLNRSHKEVDLYIEDHNCGFVLNNQFYYDFIRGLIVLQKEKNIQKVEKDLPLLILAGGTDPVGKYGKKVKELYQAYATVSSNIELKLYKGARHEILLEENQEEVYTDILNWLEKYE